MSGNNEFRAFVSGLEALKRSLVRTEGYYDILENDEGELLFTIKHLDSPLNADFKPVIYYDGGPHAIFAKNVEVAIILDFIHPGVRGTLSGLSEALIAELKDGGVAEEYMADVMHIDGLEEIADEYMD